MISVNAKLMRNTEFSESTPVKSFEYFRVFHDDIEKFLWDIPIFGISANG
jgi:hypothetical protein